MYSCEYRSLYNKQLKNKFLKQWQPKIQLCWKEKNETKRKRKPTHNRDTAPYTNSKGKRSIPDGNKFYVVFVKHKKYTICYGYKRKFRHSENNPSLSVPFSVLLARKEFGVYSLAGSTVVKIRI